jgi:hypothetical protein
MDGGWSDLTPFAFGHHLVDADLCVARGGAEIDLTARIGIDGFLEPMARKSFE